jgi:hypothetical protein
VHFHARTRARQIGWPHRIAFGIVYAANTVGNNMAADGWRPHGLNTGGQHGDANNDANPAEG